MWIRLKSNPEFPIWTIDLGVGIHHGGHTFASRLLQRGESPAYVQRQLGHASIKLTVGTYGKWLPMGNKAAINRLDDESGSKNGDGHPGCCRSARRDWWAVKDSNLGPAD